MGPMTDWITTGERPLPHFVTPFAKPASGGKAKDDDDSDDEDDDDDPDDDEDDDDLADLSEDEVRAQLRETRTKLANQSERAARRRKRERREREAANAAPKKPAAKPAAKDADEDTEAAKEAARREGESAGTLRAKRAEGKSALLAAGVNPARVGRAVGLLDLDDLDLDEDGLDGIDDAIDDLKKEWPELFAKQRQRRESVAGDGDRDGKGGRKKEMTTSERQAAAALGRSR